MKTYYKYEEFINNLDTVKKDIYERLTELTFVITVRVDSKAQHYDVLRVIEEYQLYRVCPTMYPGWHLDYCREENVTHATFQPLFEDELQLLNNPVCHQCDAQIRHPLLPWNVGAQFSDSDRIVFVGNTHNNMPGEILSSGIIDPTDWICLKEDKHKWPCWHYTSRVADELYGGEYHVSGHNAMEFIAFTNLIKCTNVGTDGDSCTSTDKTTDKMAESCVIKLGVIWKEIELLEARTVVFYTYGRHRKMLQDIPFAVDGSIHEITSINHTVPCKKTKRIGWWERECRTDWTDNLRILVVGYPHSRGQEEFVELLANWIRPDRYGRDENGNISDVRLKFIVGEDGDIYCESYPCE
jgi:hypothetical protein